MEGLEDLLTKKPLAKHYTKLNDYTYSVLLGNEYYIEIQVHILTNSLGDNLQELIDEITKQIFEENGFRFNTTFVMKKDRLYIMIKNNKIGVVVKGESVLNYDYRIYFGDEDITERYVK